MSARSRYDHLTSYRNHFLDIAVECSELTLPYLIQRDELRPSHRTCANLGKVLVVKR